MDVLKDGPGNLAMGEENPGWSIKVHFEIKTILLINLC